MNFTTETTAFDRGINPLLRMLLPPEKIDDILSFRVDPNLSRRIEELAAKNTEGQLTEEERSEYEGYVRANKFIAILLKQLRKIYMARR